MSTFNQINEPIEVVTIFRGNKLIPFKFLWPARPASGSVAGRQGREILVKKVNLSWSCFEGRVKFYFFAVSDDSNYFKLQFNSDNLSWTLLEVYSE